MGEWVKLQHSNHSMQPKPQHTRQSPHRLGCCNIQCIRRHTRTVQYAKSKKKLIIDGLMLMQEVHVQDTLLQYYGMCMRET